MKPAAIAKALKEDCKSLTETWIQKVRDDYRITSDEGLSKHELMDHVPAIIQEIGGLIEAGEHPDIGNTHEARASVYTRYHQGYRGSDVIRELSLLRQILCNYLLNYQPSLPLEDYAKLTQVINSYIDEEMRYAISVYGDSPAPPLQKIEEQL